jgi:dipeptidyl aminopeptidase/acylaminoacyl peptidase
MPKSTLRVLGALACLALPAFAAPSKPSDIPVESFFRRPEFTQMMLSPDGQKLAAIVPREGRGNLVVIDLAKNVRNVITNFSSIDVARAYWVDSRRLCMRVADGQEVTGEFTDRGTFCIDADGENVRDFRRLGLPPGSEGEADASRRIFPLVRASDHSGKMIVAMSLRSRYSSDVYRFDTRTGRYELLSDDSPGDVIGWVLDRHDVPRVAVSQPEQRSASDKVIRTVWYRDSADSRWEKLHQTEMTGVLEEAGAFEPLDFDFDDRTLYVSATNGEDKAAIYAYDTKTRKLGERLFRHPLIDLGDGLVFDKMGRKLLGLRYSADMPSVVWVDPAMQRLQASIDKALPKTVNRISLPDESADRALVFAQSDRDPGTYYLLDRKKGSIEELAKTRDWLEPNLMAERRFIQYPARDGMMIPAWVTVPKGGAKDLPLVVHIHGGPNVRGYEGIEWGRWPDAQFLASRGYVVLEPEPRGSTGYGRKLLTGGFRQWGQAAQDDINDGALFLVKEGLVDKSRMCLFGASYGGYAAAMGVVRDPDLWKCSAPYLAVTDLFALQGATYTDTARASYYFQSTFKKLVGDSDADREMFDRISPARHADRVKAPVFIAAGSADVRVPPSQDAAFVSALKSYSKKVEYVVYNGEGHGFNKDEHVFDYYHRLEKFLAENLKPGE